MPSCVVKWCRSNTKLKCPGITFHYFPADPIRQNKWIAAVKLERQEYDWMPVKTSRVCSVHFDEKDFYKSLNGYAMLHKTAVPICTMIRPEETSSSRDSTENEKTNNNERLQLAKNYSPSANFEVCDLPELLNETNTADPQAHGAQKRKLVATEAANFPPSTSMSQSSLENVNIPDLESIIETPTEIFLKKKLSKATMRNRRLVQDNINLNKKNLRLVRTCKRLKETVTQLKKVVKSMVNK